MGDVKDFRPPWLDGLNTNQAVSVAHLWAKVVGNECLCKFAAPRLCVRCDALARFAIDFPSIHETLTNPKETTPA